MFEAFSAMSKLVTPETTDMFSKLPALFDAWRDFMSNMRNKLDRIDTRCERIENRLNYVDGALADIHEMLILMSTETNLTPELHDGVLAMAQNDPRNAPERYSHEHA
jgi:hypothetical protein